MGRAKTTLKLLVLSCAVLVLVSSVGFSGAYFSDESSSETTQIVAGEFGPVDGDLKFTPKSLSTANQGATTVHASHPDESVIDPETVIVTVNGQPVDAPKRTCNPQKCMFEPTAQDVVEAGGVGEPSLAVTGELENGSDFEASTSIDIFEPGGADGPAHSSDRPENGSTESDFANQSEEPAADTETIDDGDANGSTSNATHDSDGDNRTQSDRETGEDSDTSGGDEDGGTAGEDLEDSGSSDDESGAENASADEMSTVNESAGTTESSAADDSSGADDGSTPEGNEPDEERAEEGDDDEHSEGSEDKADDQGAEKPTENNE